MNRNLASNCLKMDNGNIVPNIEKEEQDSSGNGTVPNIKKENIVYDDTVKYGDLSSDENDNKVVPNVMAMVTPHGTMKLRINDHIAIEVSLDRAILVTNYKYRTQVGINACIKQIGFSNKKYNILANPDEVYINITEKKQEIVDRMFVAFNQNNVVFKSSTSAVATLLDEGGVRTTKKRLIAYVEDDIPNAVFRSCSVIGERFKLECLKALHSCSYYSNEKNNYWWIHGFAIQEEMQTGIVWISKDELMPNGVKRNVYQIRTCTQSSKTFVTSLGNRVILQMSASLGLERYLFVKRQEQRVHFNKERTVVRFKGYSAGYEGSNTDDVKIF